MLSILSVYQIAGTLLVARAKALLGDPGLAGASSLLLASNSLLLGLIAASIVLAGYAIFRAAGGQGFLPGWKFWGWVIVHGMAGVVTFGGPCLFQVRLLAGRTGHRSDYLMCAGFFLPVCIGVVVLAMGRGRKMA